MGGSSVQSFTVSLQASVACGALAGPPNGFVNLFVFGGTRRNQQLGKEPPRAPAAREAARGTTSIFGGAVLGPFWVDFGV